MNEQPQQNATQPQVPPDNADDARKKKKRQLKINGWILLVIGLVIAGISGTAPGGQGYGAFVDAFGTGCLVGGIVCFILAARTKINA